MSEGRFYTVALLVFAVIVTVILFTFDYLQPDGLNWELAKEVLKIVGMIVPALLILMNMNAGRKEIKQEIQSAPVKIEDAAQTAKAVIAVAAEKAAVKLEQTADAAASKLAQPKGP
jgi:ABC-type iron transport system FetAB permease component